MGNLLGFLDVRTILFTMVVTNLVCTLVMVLLWKQNHKRLNGISFWVINLSLQTIAVILIAMRGRIPDWISMDVANVFSMVGLYLGLRGLESFFHLKGFQNHNYALLILFPLFIWWFDLEHYDLAVRHLIIGTFSFLFCIQCVWLLFFRVKHVRIGRVALVGAVFVGLCFIDLCRISDFFLKERFALDHVEIGYFEAFVILSYKVLLIVLTFGLSLMFNKSLLNDMTLQEEAFKKAFQIEKEELKASEAKFRSLFVRMSEGFALHEVVYDAQRNPVNYRIVDLNPAFEKQVGIRSEKVKGKLATEAYRVPTAPYLDVYGQVAATGEPQYFQAFFEPFDRYYDIQAFSPSQGMFATVFFDVTEKRKAAEAMIVSEARFRELNATKDKFFSIIAHDLKNPFNSILGFSQLLEESIQEKNDQNTEEYASIIRRSAQHTMDLLMNLLEWSRSQTGRMEYAPEYLEIKLLVKQELRLFDESAKQKSISIFTESFPNCTVFADKVLLSIILRNLISNALKFTNPGGTIELSSSTVGHELQVCVRDNGVGIREQDLSKVFRIEESISKPGTQNEQGTGLGLLLCKEFVEKHGGRIWVESIYGEGSAFYFTLQLNA